MIPFSSVVTSCKIKLTERLRRGNKYYFYGEELSQFQLRKFVLDNKNLPILIFEPIDQYCNKSFFLNDVPYFSLCFQNKTEEYFDIHPPSYVYKEYADKLLEELIRLGMIKESG